MVNIKINNSILQNYLMKTQNKIVTYSDIHNLVISNSPASDALKFFVKYYENSNITLQYYTF